MRPPRALWVPFELGRPFGIPGDAAFQQKVLRSALELLDAERGPVLVDFPEDAPLEQESDEDTTEGWTCPVNLGPLPDDGESELGAAFKNEIALLAPWYDIAVTRRGRTNADSCGLTIEEIGVFLLSLLDDDAPATPPPGQSMGAALNLASEDLKAYYLEAVTAQPGLAPSTDTADWFWGETVAAKVLFALRARCSKNDDEHVRAVGERLLVPWTQLHRADH